MTDWGAVNLYVVFIGGMFAAGWLWHQIEKRINKREEMK